MRERIEEAARLMAGGEQDRAERVLEERPENAWANYLMASLCDQRGQERRAVPFYRRALAASEELSEEELAGAYLGLGSTYRVLGDYEESRRVLREGKKRFPADRALSTFLALPCTTSASTARRRRPCSRTWSRPPAIRASGTVGGPSPSTPTV